MARRLRPAGLHVLLLLLWDNVRKRLKPDRPVASMRTFHPEDVDEMEHLSVSCLTASRAIIDEIALKDAVASSTVVRTLYQWVDTALAIGYLSTHDVPA